MSKTPLACSCKINKDETPCTPVNELITRDPNCPVHGRFSHLKEGVESIRKAAQEANADQKKLVDGQKEPTPPSKADPLEEILDLADPNHPTDFWRKQRAKERLNALIHDREIAALEEIKIAFIKHRLESAIRRHKDKGVAESLILALNDIENTIGKRISELKGKKQ